MKWKTIAGIVLIALSVAAMYIWETRGRDRLLLQPVLSAAADMEAGHVVTEEDLSVLEVLPQTAVSGALSPADAGQIIGLRAGHRVAANQQLLPSDFAAAGVRLPKGKSVYVLPSEWILSRSCSLRAGDKVQIYAMPEKKLLGTYSLAFVRDTQEQEVVDLERADGVLGRTSPSSIISSLEIICTNGEFFSIYDAVQEAGPFCLLVVMEEKQWEES
ncbi:MAG: SAF domain-containing protein [Clostridia bacterium]|nr:SAF domain-containing protein [Clostridia bacterium]